MSGQEKVVKRTAPLINGQTSDTHQAGYTHETDEKEGIGGLTLFSWVSIAILDGMLRTVGITGHR